MVTVKNYILRTRKDQTTFVVLELLGGLEMIKSNATGKYYASMKKTSVPSTFDEETAKLLIGSQLPGEIVKQECDPYEFVANKQTGEIMMLNYTYAYQASANDLVMGHTKITEMEMA